MTATSLPRSRQELLLREISIALSRTQKPLLLQWGRNSAVLWGRVTLRRATNLLGVFSRIGKTLATEAINAKVAFDEKRLSDHARQRGKHIGETASAAATDVTRAIKRTQQALSDSPRETAPALVIYSLAFLASSGGVDGDGGVPDLDLIAGIDAHRSIFTHSIIAGATIEAMLVSSSQLISLVHSNLPATHDPIWDAIAAHKDTYLAAASGGASLGIAYHLFIDSVVEPAAYHDLPGSHSIETHQAIMGANAAAEGIDASKKRKSFMTARMNVLHARSIRPRDVRSDGKLTLPPSYGVYSLPRSVAVGRRYRLGNYPIRMHELEREYGSCKLVYLFLRRSDAVEMSAALNSRRG